MLTRAPGYSICLLHFLRHICSYALDLLPIQEMALLSVGEHLSCLCISFFGEQNIVPIPAVLTLVFYRISVTMQMLSS